MHAGGSGSEQLRRNSTIERMNRVDCLIYYLNVIIDVLASMD